MSSARLQLDPVDKILLQLDPVDKILLRRNLGKDGKAGRVFATEVMRRCDKYVPFRMGPLKNTARIEGTKIIYPASHAKKNYYSNTGRGQDGTAAGGLRGKQWDKRMMAAEGKECVKAVVRYVGGRQE